MILESPGSVALKLGILTIHWYGIIIALAFVTGLTVSARVAKMQGDNPEHIVDLATYLLIAGIACARLYYVIFNWSYYSSHLSETFKVWHGGLSIHGAFIGAILTLLIYSRIHKISPLKYADILSYGAVLGQSIGRWGNFFNSEAFGTPTNGWIKLYIPPELRPEAYQHYNYFHPTFLYESIWDLTVFLLLYFVLRNKLRRYNGAVFFTYIILYSIGRFIIEGIRIDSITSIFGLPLAQFVSIILIIAGSCGLYFVTVYRKRSGQ